MKSVASIWCALGVLSWKCRTIHCGCIAARVNDSSLPTAGGLGLSSVSWDEFMESLASAGQEILLKVTESKPDPVILSPSYTSELIDLYLNQSF